VALLRANRLDDAYKVLLKTNPFPSICGRVCDHQCETKCRRSTLDEPVSIRNLKRFITDHGSRPPVQGVVPTRKEKIAIIGGGPSGLTAARDLALRRYHVTIFDEFPEPGGMLRWGIPEYRLPRDILRKEIEDILNLGVDLKANTKVGRDVAWEHIQKTFDAVYLAIGAQRSVGFTMEGASLQGVVGAVEFLRELNIGKTPFVGERVAVIGGGNTAIDAARSALRLGAKEVTILYRRTREEMPAQEAEIKAAEEEGVKIRYLVAPIRLLGASGHVQKAICRNMVLGEFDSSGRKKPVSKLGEDTALELEQVILAIGQEPEYPFDRGAVPMNKNGLIDVVKGKKTETQTPMVFAGGDVVYGPDTVVRAIAAGHHAAIEIDHAIRSRNGEPALEIVTEEEIAIPQRTEEEVHENPRTCTLEASCVERAQDFREVELGLSTEGALKESCRCLRCDVKA
jgi:NADPH-dependent glutamate synthase beta subunit-like oxidoreductase